MKFIFKLYFFAILYLNFKLLIVHGSNSIEDFLKVFNNAMNEISEKQSKSEYEYNCDDCNDHEKEIQRYYEIRNKRNLYIDDLIDDLNLIDSYSEDTPYMDEISIGDNWYKAFLSSECGYNNNNCSPSEELYSLVVNDDREPKKKLYDDCNNNVPKTNNTSNNNTMSRTENIVEYEVGIDTGELNNQNDNSVNYNSKIDHKYNKNFKKIFNRKFGKKSPKMISLRNRKRNRKIFHHSDRFDNKKYKHKREFDKVESIDNVTLTITSTNNLTTTTSITPTTTELIEWNDQNIQTKYDLPDEANNKLSNREQDEIAKISLKNYTSLVNNWLLPTIKLGFKTRFVLKEANNNNDDDHDKKLNSDFKDINNRLPNTVKNFKNNLNKDQLKSYNKNNFINNQNRIRKSISKKRCVDPMSVIKLKISNRLFSKGLGSSLPSTAIERRNPPSILDAFNKNHEIYKHNNHKNHKCKSISDIFNIWKRDAQKTTIKPRRPRRKHIIKSTGNRNTNTSDEINTDDGNKTFFTEQNLYSSSDPYIRNLYNYSKLIVKPSPEMQEIFDYYEKLSVNDLLSGRDPIEIFKNMKKRNAVLQKYREDMDHDKIFGGYSVKFNYKIPAKKIRSTKNYQSNIIKINTRNNDTEGVNLKFNVSIDAILRSNDTKINSLPKIKLNRSYSKNQIKKITNHNHGMRWKRETQYSHHNKRHIIENNESSSSDNSTKGNQIASTPSAIVNAVYEMIKNNSEFQIYIYPGLNMKNKEKISNNLPTDKIKENNNHPHNIEESKLKESLKMIRFIIEQEVRARTCIKLDDDLQSFYHTILKTQKETKRMWRKNQRERKKSYRKHLSQFRYNTNKKNGRPSLLREKYSIIKNLLKEYKKLPINEQKKITNIKNILKSYLKLLKNYEIDENNLKRKKRQTKNQHKHLKLIISITDDLSKNNNSYKIVNNNQTIQNNNQTINGNKTINSSMNGVNQSLDKLIELTPEFMRLYRTAGLFRSYIYPFSEEYFYYNEIEDIDDEE